MAGLKNYYQVLGVETFAEPDAVKSAFRKLARKFHPDLNGNNRIAEERFKEINEAYEVLSNPDKRAMHDATLQALRNPKHGPPPKTAKSGASADEQRTKPDVSTNRDPGGGKTGSTKPHTAPNSAAGSGAREATGKPHKEEANRAPAGTPLNDFFENFLKKGEGGAKTDPDDPIFKGAAAAGSKSAGPKEPGTASEKPQRGEDVVVKTAIAPQEALEGVVKTVNVQHNEICRRCSGTGRVNGTVCPVCNGEKITTRLKKIDVRIPAGVKNGSRVRVAKEGGRGLGGAENGDLFLQIEISYDASLRIEGVDVHGDAQISVTLAVLGGEIEVPTLNGNVKMTIAPGTQSGQVFRLKERGVHSGMTKGDHFVTVHVIVPDNLSARERELYQELARLRPDSSGGRKKP